MVDPPLEAGAVKADAGRPLPALGDSDRRRAGGGGAAGTTGFEALEAGPVPMALVAVTVKV